jgi:hypothetical protein
MKPGRARIVPLSKLTDGIPERELASF